MITEPERLLLDFIDKHNGSYSQRVNKKLIEIARIINGKNRDNAELPYWVQSSAIQYMLRGVILAMRGIGIKDAKSLVVNPGFVNYPKGRCTIASNVLATQGNKFLSWLLSRYAQRLWNELPQEDKSFCYHACTANGKGLVDIGLKSIGGDIIERCLSKYKLARQLCNQLTQNLC